MSLQLPKPYYYPKRYLLFAGVAPNVACPQCGGKEIAQRPAELIDPVTGKMVYPPEAIIMTLILMGFAAAVLIVVGGWLALVGGLLEAVVLYGAFVRLPVAFRAREVQLFHFQCGRCTIEWSTSLF
jgi:hypothetical protein